LANKCLTSPLLHNIGFEAYIPSTLIYSCGVIRVDTFFSEEELWDGLNKEIRAISFKRISTKKYGSLTPTRIVELKFLSAKIPDSLSIYNVIFKISSSIRSPLQYNNCLRFGHMAKFCRNKARYSHCVGNNHLLNACPAVNVKVPCYIFCKLPHLATDRKCRREWQFQRDVKMIMTNENIPFHEAIHVKEQNYSNSAFTYYNIVSKQSERAFPQHVSLLSDSTFPKLADQPLTYRFPHRKSRNRSPHQLPKKFYTPGQNNSSLPGSHFIDYVASKPSQLQNIYFSELTWVSVFSKKLSESLINTSCLSSQTPSSL